MPYRYLDDLATADVAFEAWGDTPEDMFAAAADATLNVMVEELSSISEHETRRLHIRSDSIEMLLFHLLQELIYYKDAEQLLLRVRDVKIESDGEGLALNAEAYGEQLNPEKHELIVDVKAVTMHQFEVRKTPEGWWARVILDI